MTGEKIKFPVADGTVKLSGRDQVLRTSTLIRDRGKEQGHLPGESDGSSSTLAVKQEMISGPFLQEWENFTKWVQMRCALWMMRAVFT